MDGHLRLGIIFMIFMFIIIIAFIASIVIFSIILYRRISEKVSSTERFTFGLMLILINLFMVIGAYFFIFKDLFE